MAGDFKPCLDLLPSAQRRLWEELASVPEEFALYDGTATALHLGHRQSIDFDFFSKKKLDPARLVPAIPFLADATVTQREPNAFSGLVDRDGSVKLSFFGLPWLRQLLPPLVAPDNGLRIASLLDLAGMKASVVQQRAEAKDYIDIAAILAEGKIDLSTMLGAARTIHGNQFNPQSTLKALSYFDDGNLSQLPRTVTDLLAEAARNVDLDRLPAIPVSERADRGDREPS